MDNGIVLIVIVITAAVAATVVWFGLRRNLPPDVAAEVAAYVAAISHALGSIVDEQVIATLAGAAYDAWGSGSKYLTRDEFVALVVKAIGRQPIANEAVETAAVMLR